MILYLMLRPQATNVLGSVKFGIVSVTEDAATADAFPDADIAGDEADWLFRGAAHALMSSVNEGHQLTRVHADIGTSRVLHGATDETHFIIDQDSSGMTITYALFARVLVRLP